MKICCGCKELKALTEFQKQKSCKDKLTTQCRECRSKKSRDYYITGGGKEKWIEREKKRKAENRKKYSRSDRVLAPEKLAAGYKITRMIPVIKGNHLHHWSYNEEHYKDVIELSHQEHAKLHRYMVYDPEEKKYRRRDNLDLLWSRNIHIMFYRSLKDKP